MYRYLSRSLTHIHKINDLLKIMHICQMYRYLSRDLTQMHNENLYHRKTAILEKCQITWFLSGNLTHIHKNSDILKFIS
mgnify:CR=1 FL=1